MYIEGRRHNKAPISRSDVADILHLSVRLHKVNPSIDDRSAADQAEHRRLLLGQRDEQHNIPAQPCAAPLMS